MVECSSPKGGGKSIVWVLLVFYNCKICARTKSLYFRVLRYAKGLEEVSDRKKNGQNKAP